MADSKPSEQQKPALNIGLALSGGGFRATLFHLGLVRFLRDAGCEAAQGYLLGRPVSAAETQALLTSQQVALPEQGTTAP